MFGEHKLSQCVRLSGPFLRVRTLGLHLGRCPSILISTTARNFSSLNVSEPFQPSPSRDHRYRFHPCFLHDLLISLVVQQAHSMAIAPFSYLLLPYDFRLKLTLTMFRSRTATSVESLSGISVGYTEINFL